jgi:hypothetical protein
MNLKRLAKLRHRATQAIEGSRGDGFAEVVLELVAELEIAPPEPPELDAEVKLGIEASGLDPTPVASPKRKRKVAEAGGDLSRAD